MSHGYSVHEGVSCDGCGYNNFTGNRYKCLRCYDFDLCHACYTGQRFPLGAQLQHIDSHPMQMMLTQRDFEIVYDGDQTKNWEICKICSFTCPVCGQSGLTIRTYGSHINTHSYPLEEPVYCPLCIAYPGDSNRPLNDLKEHMTNCHSHFDNAPYRTEPAARTTNRRPVLARRTQRQPAGQAGTFTQQLGINLPLNTLGWPADDVEDMLRNVNFQQGRNIVSQNVANRIQRLQNNQGLNQLNQMLNVGLHPNLPQIWGAPRQGEPQTPAQTLQTYQQANQNILRSLNNAIAAPAHQTAIATRSTGEYAQPRHATQRQPPVNQPIARLLRSTPIFPVTRFDEENMMSSDENAELTEDEVEYASALDGIPALEADSSQEEEADTNASTSGISLQPMRDESSQGNAETDGEFDFENAADESTDSSDTEEIQPTNGVKIEQSSAFPTEKEILQQLSENTTATEFSQLMRILQEDPESDYEPEESDERHFSDCTEGGDSLEDHLSKLVWSTIQFEVPPLYSFGINDTWNDQRFLRHRKLHRKLSCASSMEDTLKKADVALSFLSIAAGKDALPNAKPPRILDKPDRSVKRALRSMKLDVIPERLSNRSRELLIPVPPTPNSLSNGVSISDENSKEKENPRPSLVKFQSSIDDGPRPDEAQQLYIYYDGGNDFGQAPDPPPGIFNRDSSEDEEGRSLVQEDDVDFIIDDSDLQQ